jgi:hypothetical protein
MFAIVTSRTVLGWSHGHSIIIEVAGTFQQLTSPHQYDEQPRVAPPQPQSDVHSTAVKQTK